ncbi:MAG: hypothetical protein ACO1OB_27470 [Archangium sp.]
MVKLAALISLISSSAFAYSIGSAFADPCHERITANALRSVTFELSDTDGNRPAISEEEKQLANWLEARLGEADITSPFDDRRILNSFLVGVRHPDVEGWQLRDLASIRSLQLDLDGQSAHFLRAPEDVNDEGNASAVEKSRAYIMALIVSSKRSYDAGAEVVKVPTWIEHYPNVDVPLIEAVYLLAQALHAVQDSFSHTYRSQDARQVNAVLTYLGTFTPGWNERGFGPLHNTFLDDCTAPENATSVDAATRASAELMSATLQYWRSGDVTQVEAVLNRWESLQPGCSLDNQYCASPTFTLVQEKAKSGGCSEVPGGALLLGAVWLLRRRRCTRRA